MTTTHHHHSGHDALDASSPTVRQLAGPWLGAEVGVGPFTATVVVVWRPQTVRCCGERLIVADATRPPIWHENEGRDCDAVHAELSQCPFCSSGYAAEIVVVDDWGNVGDWGENDWIWVHVSTAGTVHVAATGGQTLCGRTPSPAAGSPKRLPRVLVSCDSCLAQAAFRRRR